MLNLTYLEDKRLQYPLPKPATWPAPRAVRELVHEVIRTAGAAIFPGINLDMTREGDSAA